MSSGSGRRKVEAKTSEEWTIYGFFLLPPLMLDESLSARTRKNTHVLPQSVPLSIANIYGFVLASVCDSAVV